MFTVYECVACVVLVFTMSTLLFALCVVLLTVEWKIESLVRKSGEIPDGFFSPSAMRNAIVGQRNFLYAWCLRSGANMGYRLPVLATSSDPLIRDSQAQSTRHSLR
jgi:hypothetical protein